MVFYLLFIVLVITDTNSQIAEVNSKVYLYDGSVYIGKILNAVPNESIRIQLNDTAAISIPNFNIKKIVQKDHLKKYKIHNQSYEFSQKGYYNVNYLVISGGSSGEGMTTLGTGLSSSFGYMFNKYFLHRRYPIGWYIRHKLIRHVALHMHSHPELLQDHRI